MAGSPAGTMPNDPQDIKANKRLEWGFAGTSEGTKAVFEDGKLFKPAHTVWTHWVDSRTLEQVQDEGFMYDQENGEVLEKGAMAHPVTGAITDYEEVWKDLDASIVGHDKRHICQVLRYDGPSREERGMLIRIGEYIQGVRRSGTKITVIRWQWIKQEVGSSNDRISVYTKRFQENSTGGIWTRTLAIGDGAIPCKSLFSGESGDAETEIALGKVVEATDGTTWGCIESFLW